MKKENSEDKYCQCCKYHKNHPGTCYIDTPIFMGRKQPACADFKRKKGVK